MRGAIKMTGWERFGELGKELWLIFKPTDPQSVWQLVILIAIILGAFLLRKYGGFWKNLMRIFGTIVLLMILNVISPYLMWGILGLSLIWLICETVHVPIKGIIICIVAIAVFIIAFYNAFLA